MRPFPLMLFAAGFGTRMGALTAERPKPLIRVAGRPLIDHALALADAAQVAPVVVNLHYRGDQIADHLRRRNLLLSWEKPDILDTGGGLKAALPLLGPGAVMTLNTDAVWTGQNPLQELAAAWDGARMEALLLLLPVAQALGHGGKSDFRLSPEGRIGWAAGAEGHVYLGAQILAPEAVSAIAEPVFGLRRVWDDLIARGRAHGLVHRGGWCDVGHPGGIAQAEKMLHHD